MMDMKTIVVGKLIRVKCMVEVEVAKIMREVVVIIIKEFKVLIIIIIKVID